MIELHLLRNPVFATATAANVVFGIAFGAMLLLVTLWCQDVWGWSALRTGLGRGARPADGALPVDRGRPDRPQDRPRAGRRPRLHDLRGRLRVLAAEPLAHARLPRAHAPRHAADRDRRRPHAADPGQRGRLGGPAVAVRDRVRDRHHGPPGRHRPRRGDPGYRAWPARPARTRSPCSSTPPWSWPSRRSRPA